MKKILLVLGFCLMTLSLFAQERKQLNYPINCTTTIEKAEFCYIAQEKLRLEHNEMGRKYKDGKITEQEWRNYKNNDFEIKERIITTNLALQKEEMKKSTKYEVDLNALEKK